MSRGKRQRIADGVYLDKYGVSAIVRVRPFPAKEHRFPSDTPIDEIQAWRHRIRGELLEERQKDKDAPAPAAGTFMRDIERYLKTIKSRVAFKSDRSHLRAWLPFLSRLTRRQITPTILRSAIDAWTADKKSARTILHRRRVLREMYAELAPRSPLPLDQVTWPTPATPHPTPVPMATIRKVAKSLKRGLTITKRHGPARTLAETQVPESPQTYARFLVRATTWQRPGQIMRATPEDVDLRRKIWFVRPAKGGNAIPLPLSAPAVHAWRLFIQANAWGAFDLRSFAKTLRRHGWPKNVRPYNLRHTGAIDFLRQGGSLDDLQGLLGHRQIETTRRHYGPILLARLRKAINRNPRRIA